jgi:hypothetical protein
MRVSTPCSSFFISVVPPPGIVANINGSGNTSLVIYTAVQSTVPFTFATNLTAGNLTLNMVVVIIRSKYKQCTVTAVGTVAVAVVFVVVAVAVVVVVVVAVVVVVVVTAAVDPAAGAVSWHCCHCFTVEHL